MQHSSDGKDSLQSFWLADDFSCSLAATAVGIPSILITNFTFDSVYSYLSTTLVDAPASPTDGSHSHFNALVPDIPVSRTELEPLGIGRIIISLQN
jgi:hypothetical protein